MFYILPIEDELNRVMNNPDNVIVSDHLAKMLDLSPEQGEDQQKTEVTLASESHKCTVLKAIKDKGQVEFVLLVPSLKLESYLLCDTPITMTHRGVLFTQKLETPSEFSEGTLTLSTRRIVNETVHV
tara:strand:+ start:519 stop:899 length:381 start_codon:yes stop_codon:yes gene_type:complete